MNKTVTIGIFAHANAGKTTVTEHLLYQTKVIKTIGRVDKGNTTTDGMKIEKQRGISVRSAMVSFSIEDKKIQLIDTPGHIDFSAEVERAICVLDGAILVLSGVEGVEAQTYTIWKALKQRNIPIIFFINKMDRIGADYNKILKQIKNKLTSNIFPTIECSLINKNLILSETNQLNKTLNLSELDEETLNLYVNHPKKITKKWLEKRTTNLIHKGVIYPVICGSALIGKGILELKKCIQKYIPPMKQSSNKTFSAYVYMTRVINNQKNTYVKILSGNLNLKDFIQITEKKKEKVKELFITNGIELNSIKTATAGDIVILRGLSISTGQFIGNTKQQLKFPKFVKPMFNLEFIPCNSKQLIDLGKALKILELEDPYLNIIYEKKTGKIFASLIGTIQAETIITMLKERFNIESKITNPTIIHKETPGCKSLGKASYTKFSGVEFEITPLTRGSGLIYLSKLQTGVLHKKYQRQTERLVKHYIKQGLYGWELTDAKITLVNGRFNSTGSNPMHFNVIVPLALIRALKKCKTKILEPMVDFFIQIPNEYLNLIYKELASINAIFKIQKENLKTTTLKGKTSLKNILNFQAKFLKITSGEGQFAFNLSHYQKSLDQNITGNYFGEDPRNETTFVIAEMKGSLEPLDNPFTKKKKESSSKFKRKQREKQNHK